MNPFAWGKHRLMDGVFEARKGYFLNILNHIVPFKHVHLVFDGGDIINRRRQGLYPLGGH